MKKIYIFIISMLFVFTAGAQPWNSLIDSDTASFFDIQKAFNDYWAPYNIVNGKYIENGVEKKAYGWKQFKRWEWFWEPRVDENGMPPKADINQTELDNYLSSQPESSSLSPSWSYAGIDNTNSGYEGIGRVNCVAFHPNQQLTFWVGSAGGGLWKTTDGGATWTPLTDNLAVLGISDIAIDPTNANIIYIATGDANQNFNGGAYYTRSNGVMKSIDGGNTWNPTGLGALGSDNIGINRLLIDPSNPQILLASSNAGISRTVNGGANWTQVQTSPFSDMEFHPTNPNYLYATSGYGANYGGNGTPNYINQVYRSTNNGQTWTPVYSLDPNAGRTKIAVTADYPDFVSIISASRSSYNPNPPGGCGFEGWYISGDAGSNFTKFASINSNYSNNFLSRNFSNNLDNSGQGWYDLAHSINPYDFNEIWIGGVNTWKSNDGGFNFDLSNFWIDKTHPDTLPHNVPVVHADKHFYAYHPLYANTFLECNDGGIYFTQDGGTTWTDISSGLGIGQIYRIGAASPTADNVITGLQDNGTKEYFNNIWYEHPPGGDGMECIIDHSNASTEYCTVMNGMILKTYNSWSNFEWDGCTGQGGFICLNGGGGLTGVNGAGSWITPYLMHPTDPNTLIVGKDQVYKTTNQGINNNFTQISTLSFPATPTGQVDDLIMSMAYAPSNPQYIYIANRYNLYRTSNGGSSWAGPFPSNNNDQISDVVIDPNNPLRVVITKSGYSFNNKVWESTDGGNTWTNISGGTALPNVPINCIEFEDNSNKGLYIGTDLGVFYKTNTTAWIKLDNGLPNVIVTELEISYVNNKLWAGTYGRGLWECNLVFSGCTDPLACNYNPQANINDNSCSYMSVNASSTDVTCYGGTNGTAIVVASTGAAPYTYQWSTGSTNSTITGLYASTYGCTVTDANGCSITSSVVISEPPAINLVMASTPECYASNDGTASVTTVSNGAAPYTYLWSTGSTNSLISGLYASTYGCTVTDANGCTTNSSVVVSQLQAISLNILSTPLSTSCSNDATATISASGGTPPFTYQWNDANTQTSVMAINLSSGTYTCMVTDTNGCSISDSVVIGQAQGISLTMSSVGVTCYGYTDGTATATYSGGTPPFTYQWSTGATTPTITGLYASTYGVTVMDADSCSQTSSVTVTAPDVLSLNMSADAVVCYGGNSGTADIVVTGGTSPYTYQWSTGASVANLSNLNSGYHICIVTDGNNCQSLDSIFVSQPAQLAFNASLLDFNGFGVSCYGVSDGQIIIQSISGGTPNYTSSIYGGANYSSSMNYSALSVGAYDVMVKDANDCVSSSTPINITSPSPFSGVIVQPNIDLQANVNGGVPPYTYLWNTNQTTQTISPQSNGIYWCIITDANNCMTNKIYRTVNNTPSAIAELEISNLSIYPNPNDGYFTIEFSSLITQDLKVKIANAIGEIVFVDNTENFIGKYKKQINLNDYAKGIYFLEIETHKGTANKKIVLY